MKKKKGAINMGEININVEHLTRVEGHGNIILNAKDGTIEKKVCPRCRGSGYLERY